MTVALGIDTRSTFDLLDRLGTEILAEASPAVRPVLQDMAAAARARVPDWPLRRAFRNTGWKPNRGRLRYDAPRIRASIRVRPGRVSGYSARLGTLTMTDPAGTLLDMAARGRTARTVPFVNALYAYGKPSRILWPSATARFGDLERALLDYVDSRVARTNRELTRGR